MSDPVAAWAKAHAASRMVDRCTLELGEAEARVSRLRAALSAARDDAELAHEEARSAAMSAPWVDAERTPEPWCDCHEPPRAADEEGCVVCWACERPLPMRSELDERAYKPSRRTSA